MNKQIKKYGSSNIILLSPEELKFYGLKKGDWVKVSIKKIEKEDN